MFLPLDIAPKCLDPLQSWVSRPEQTSALAPGQGTRAHHLSLFLLSDCNWRQNWLNINPIVFSQPSLGQTQRSENQLNQSLPFPPPLDLVRNSLTCIRQILKTVPIDINYILLPIAIAFHDLLLCCCVQLGFKWGATE